MPLNAGWPTTKFTVQTRLTSAHLFAENSGNVDVAVDIRTEVMMQFVATDDGASPSKSQGHMRRIEPSDYPVQCGIFSFNPENILGHKLRGYDSNSRGFANASFRAIVIVSRTSLEMDDATKTKPIALADRTQRRSLQTRAKAR